MNSAKTDLNNGRAMRRVILGVAVSAVMVCAAGVWNLNTQIERRLTSTEVTLTLSVQRLEGVLIEMKQQLRDMKTLSATYERVAPSGRKFETTKADGYSQ